MKKPTRSLNLPLSLPRPPNSERAAPHSEPQILCVFYPCWPPSVRVDYGCVSSWGRHRRLWLCRPILDRQVLPQLLQVKAAALDVSVMVFIFCLLFSHVSLIFSSPVFECRTMVGLQLGLSKEISSQITMSMPVCFMSFLMTSL